MNEWEMGNEANGEGTRSNGERIRDKEVHNGRNWLCPDGRMACAATLERWVELNHWSLEIGDWWVEGKDEGERLSLRWPRADGYENRACAVMRTGNSQFCSDGSSQSTVTRQSDDDQTSIRRRSGESARSCTRKAQEASRRAGRRRGMWNAEQ